ncbi:protein itfg3 [Lasius niger]|uniref:Protein itfg3 n=1 Tax=Lasius niger TaxID=67767 RepID=A0A0J7KL33_LASNI|nr:protein itfg3 [Lasius niger]
MSTDHSGKGYTPLPQNISNTDTEDEEERLTRPNHITYKIDNTTTIAELHSGHENGMFCPLDETQNLGNSARNRQNTIKCYQDDIPVMVIEGSEQNDFWRRRDMSPMRRFCLFASILLCIVTIVIFLYVLPCDSSMICPPIIESQSSISWDKTLQDVEIYGPITTVPGSPYNLIFLLRGEQYRENDTKNTMIQRQISPEGGGVMSMQGNSGLPLWLVPLKKSPTIIDCTSIDIDQSGKPDCIVAGEQGLLVSIEPIAGTIHWSATTHTFSKLPVILPDINADNIEDLLSVAVDDANMLYLAFLSGKTGQLLERYSVNNCTSIDIYNLVSNNKILFNCYDNNAKRMYTVNTIF